MEIYYHKAAEKNLPPSFSAERFEQAAAFHQSLENYLPTPLIGLPNLAEKLGVRGIYLKDESKRFGLNAFKALGASYAAAELVKAEGKNTFVTATDGNHGRAVAWAAHGQGCRAVVFMPAGTAQIRAEAIRQEGNAEVRITDRNYDDTVRMAAAYAAAHGFFLVQDTGLEGYEEIPRNIVIGYSTMAAEAAAQMETLKAGAPTHVFLQAGVGSMAGGVVGWLANYYRESFPAVGIVEAEETACIFESVRQERTVAIGGNPVTAMAGLNCGEPNRYILPILKEYASYYFKCEDEVSFAAMRMLAHPCPGDEQVTSGECGAVGLGVLMKLMTDEDFSDWKKRMGLGKDSVVLLFNTEGDTDPAHYRKVVGDG